MRALADNTDGRAIINRNDLATGMKQIIRDASGYYLLGYNSTLAPTDGKFHRIEVEVTRRGVDVRARKGYWAYTAEDAARASAPARPEAPPAVTARARFARRTGRADARRGSGSGRPRARTAARKSRSCGSPFHRSPASAGRGDESPASVNLIALAADGRPLFKGRVPDRPQGAAPTGTSAPTPSAASTSVAPTGAQATFDAPPGRLQLRMVVEAATGQVLDSATRDLTVPDYTTVQVSFGTTRVFRARSPRESQQIKANPDAMPVVDRSFSRTERLLLRVDAYAPGGAAPGVTARLLNRGGTSMFDLPVQVSPSGTAELELTLGQLGAGDYLIELTAKTDSGTAQELVAFKVNR